MTRNPHRILLIEPPFYRLFKNTYSLDKYPLSLGYLAGMVKKETNWSVVAYNSDFNPQSEVMKVSYLASTGYENYLNNLKDLSGKVWKEVQSVISEYKPSVAGISAKAQNFASACIVAKFAKEINKQILVIVGGPYPSMVGAGVLDCSDVDICVKGEGERTIVELLKAIDAKKEFDTVQGIIYRKDGQIVENAPREYIKDLDSLCFPHENAPETLKDYEQYPKTAFRYIFATRGCPYNCFFCGSREIWSRKARFRSPENVIKEIRSLQKMGLNLIHFDDDTFGISKQYINDLCNALILNCPGLKWSCELHVNLINKQIISLIKKSGCYLIKIGIESGNNMILKKIRKNITVEKALSACRIIKKSGIDLHAFFIIGFPQETEDTLNDTIDAMKKTECDLVSYSIFTPYPGTEAFDFCKRHGLINDGYDVSLYYHQSPANCFCLNISHERFRILASRIEKIVDRINTVKRMKQIFSLNIFRKIKGFGIGESIRKGRKIFVGN